LSDVGLYLFAGIPGGLFVYLFNNTVKTALPFVSGKHLYLNPLMLFNINLLEWFKDAIFEDGCDYFRHVCSPFLVKNYD